MIKIKRELKTKEVEVVDYILCNKCGKPCPRSGIEGQWEFAELYASWGYGSNRDGRIEKSHICPDCYEEFVGDFKIKTICEHNDGFIVYAWEYEEDPPQIHERMERLLNEPSILEEDNND